MMLGFFAAALTAVWEAPYVWGQGLPQFQIVSLPPCQTAGQVVEADASTGSTISPGQQDPLWELTAVPPNQTGAFPSFATIPYSSWVAASPPGQWIHRIHNFTPQADNAGNYTYRLQFNLNPALYSSAQIVGSYAADNSATVELNGVTQTFCPGNVCFQGLHPLSITSGFISGVNDLDITVNNDSGPSPTGLLVEAKIQATCGCTRAPSGMVAWWPLDEPTGAAVVNDIAHGSNGTPKPGPVGSGGPTPGSGMVGGALGFNGTSDFVQVPNAPAFSFGAGSLSIDAWIKIPAPGTGFMPIVDKELIGFPNTSPYGYSFYVRDGHLGFSMKSDFNVNPHGSIGAEDTIVNLADNAWHHVAVTVQRNPSSATGGTLLIDGAPLLATFSTTPFVNLSADNTGDLILGSANALIRISANAYFNGSIDEVEVFNRALAQTEIQGIFDAGAAGKCKPNCVPPPSGMVEWLTGDNNANDVSGNGNNGTLQGSATYTTGEVLDAFQINASGDFVEIQDSPSVNFGTGDLSIDSWIKTTALDATIIDKRTGTSTNPVGYTLFLFGGKLGFQLSDGLPFSNNVSAGPVINDANWHHVAVAINRTSSAGGNLYVDGTLVGTFDPTPHAGTTSNTGRLRIGQRVISSPQAFQGAIDEVELFNRELSQGEIQTIYGATWAGKCKPICVQPPSGMVAWYPLDETAGQTIIHDLWTNSLTGTALNPSGTPAPVSGGGPQSIVGQHVRNSLYFPNGPYVSVANDPHLNFFSSGIGEFSIDAWVRVLGSGGPDPNEFLSPIVDKTAPAGAGPNTIAGYALLVDYPPNLGAAQLAFVLGDGLSAVTSPTLLQPAALSAGWHHVAVTVARPAANQAPAKVDLYVDGQPQTGGPATVQVGNTDNSAPLWIGKSRLNSIWNSGLEEIAIDELELFDRALAPTEVQALYVAGSVGKCRTSDLAISTEVRPSQLASGQEATITLAVTNVGGAPCGGVTTVTDSVPEGLVVLGVAQGGSLWNCSVTGANPPATLTCAWDASIQPVPPGPLPPITITTNVTAPAGTSITNCATLSNPNDTNSANDQSCVTISAPRLPRHRLPRT